MGNNSQLPTQPQRSLPAIIFISPSEPRLRAGWRLLLQTLMFLIFGILIGLPVGVLTYAVQGGVTWSTLYFLINIAVELAAVAASVSVARHFLDKRSFVSLGFKLDGFVIYDLVTGIAITFCMMGSIYAAMWS